MKNNCLTDEILFDALAIYEKDWFENTEFDFSDFNPSDKFKKNMQRMIKSCDNIYYKITLTKVRRIVCIIAAIIAILCSSLSVGAVREFLEDFFIKRFATHDTIGYDKESAKSNEYPQKIEKIYELDYIPEGFELMSCDTTETDVFTLYLNNDKQIYIVQSVKLFYDLTVDNENSVKSVENINGQEYMIYTSTNSSDITLIWDNGEYIFTMTSNLAKNDLINLCESLKVKQN